MTYAYEQSPEKGLHQGCCKLKKDRASEETACSGRCQSIQQGRVRGSKGIWLQALTMDPNRRPTYDTDSFKPAPTVLESALPHRAVLLAVLLATSVGACCIG